LKKAGFAGFFVFGPNEMLFRRSETSGTGGVRAAMGRQQETALGAQTQAALPSMTALTSNPRHGESGRCPMTFSGLACAVRPFPLRRKRRSGAVYPAIVPVFFPASVSAFPLAGKKTGTVARESHLR